MGAAAAPSLALALACAALGGPVRALAQSGFATRPYTAPGFRLPEGAGCSGAIARWQALQANDYATGNVNPSVHKQIESEIAAASAACAGGRDRQAQAMVAASRRRHGYPAH